MKRPRPSSTPLSATELAAVLNGDDPVALYRTLQRFARTVRRQRRVALLDSEDTMDDSDDGEDDSSSSSQDEDDNDAVDDPDTIERQTKYKKGEAWKQDTAAYNVPFVGTSVATSTADTAVIVKGQWPTGLLRAYLTKSPRVVEFVGLGERLWNSQPDGDTPFAAPTSRLQRLLQRHKKGRRLQQSLQKTYLRALQELVTAAIPPSRLMPQLNKSVARHTSDSVDTAYTAFVDNLTTFHRLDHWWRLLRAETVKKDGGKGSNHCGPLAAPLLQYLTRLVETSPRTARDVVRRWQEQLSQHSDNMWRSLLRQRTDTAARVAALELAVALVGTPDAVVQRVVCTPGIRDRRIPTGVFYMALKEMSHVEGVKDVNNNDNDDKSEKARLDVVAGQAQVCIALRRLLTEETLTAASLSSSILADLCTKEVVQSITKIADKAPPLPSGVTYESVLALTDTYDEEVFQDAVEARRVLFLLLTNGGVTAGHKFSLPSAVAIKALTQLVGGNGGLHMHRFVLHCLSEKPNLLLPFLETYQVGNPSDDFSFLSKLRLLSRLVRQGTASIMKLIQSDALSFGPEQIGFLLFPLKKQLVVKALQSFNGLILFQTLHLIVTSLKAFPVLCPVIDTITARKVEAHLTLHLPDLPMLLKLLARLENDFNKQSDLLMCGIYELLIQLTKSVPSIINGSKVDPVKMLPKSSAALDKISPLAQLKLLKAFRTMVECTSDIHTNMTSIQIILETCVFAKRKLIYQEARECALLLLSAYFHSTGNDSDEWQACLSFEARCWIDGLTGDSIAEFCQKLPMAASVPVGGMLDYIRSWRENGHGDVPPFLVSPILMYLVKGSTQISSELRRLVQQVALKCLIFQEDPRGLASAILSSTFDDKFAHNLKAYAASILEPPDNSSETRSTQLVKAVQVIFGSDSPSFKDTVVSDVHAKDREKELVRSTSHYAQAFGVNTKSGNHFVTLFRRAVIASSLSFTPARASEYFRRYIERTAIRVCGDAQFVYLIMLLSNQRRSFIGPRCSSDSFVESLSKVEFLSTRDFRQQLLVAYLSYPLLPPSVVCRHFIALSCCPSFDSTVSSFQAVVAKALIPAVLAEQTNVAWDEESLKALWLAWKSVDHVGALAPTVHYILSSRISNSTPSAAFLLHLMEEMDSKTLLIKAIKLDHDSATKQEMDCGCFGAVLVADPSRYFRQCTALVGQHWFSEMMTVLLRRGMYDKNLATLFQWIKEPEEAAWIIPVVANECNTRLKQKWMIPQCLRLIQFIVLSEEGTGVLDKSIMLQIVRRILNLCYDDHASFGADPLITMDVLKKIILYRHKIGDSVRSDKFYQDVIESIAQIVGQQIKKQKKSKPNHLWQVLQKADKVVRTAQTCAVPGSITRITVTSAIESMVKRCLKLGLSVANSDDDQEGISGIRLVKAMAYPSGRLENPNDNSIFCHCTPS